MAKEQATLTVEEIEERMSDIQSYYLKLSRDNGDHAMVKHWQEKLRQYELMLIFLKNSQR
jgi:hypothetical protein